LRGQWGSEIIFPVVTKKIPRIFVVITDVELALRTERDVKEIRATFPNVKEKIPLTTA
jgi:hypothetical protein